MEVGKVVPIYQSESTQVETSEKEKKREQAYQEFCKQFSLEKTTTEAAHEATGELSQKVRENPLAALKDLLEVDQTVFSGVEEFQRSFLSDLVAGIRQTFAQGGRVFFVGSGTSGRVAVQLESKWRHHFSSADERVQGIIAGGEAALIRAKEGCEDSTDQGAQALSQRQVTAKDRVILISASGSASFNVGAAREAAARGAAVHYFYNSQSIPLRTERLFQEGIVQPMAIDIGPPAIAGSSRLQPATLAQLCLGMVLTELIQEGKGRNLLSLWQEGQRVLESQLEALAHWVKEAAHTLSSPQGNLRRLRDETDQGYIRFLASPSTFFDLLVDTTETAPTFSTQPPKRHHREERGKKRAELRAYLMGERNEKAAWSSTLGRPLKDEEKEEALAFTLTAYQGCERAELSPLMGEGNLVVTVVGEEDSKEIQNEAQELLSVARGRGAKTVQLSLYSKEEPDTKEADWSVNISVPSEEADPLRVLPSILTKQLANLVSNGTMAGLGKLMGNRMVDVAISNQKLLDRCIRLLRDFVEKEGREPLDHFSAYSLLQEVQRERERREQRCEYTPSAMKVAATCWLFSCSFDEALSLLEASCESLEALLEGQSLSFF